MKKEKKNEEFENGRELAKANMEKASEHGISCSECSVTDCSDHRRYLDNLERIRCNIGVVQGG